MSGLGQIKPGTAFWPLKRDGVNCHPWVVISPVVNGKVLAVNLTDQCHYDSGCTLGPADYSELKKTSVVNYPRAMEVSAATLAAELASEKNIKHLQDVRQDIVAKIVKGARESQDMTAALKSKYGLLPAAK